MIGREVEQGDLRDVLSRDEAQLVVVYGRRRVGKTYLIREFFGNKFAFYHTGMHHNGLKEQLLAFRDSLIQYGYNVAGPLDSWHDAFLGLRRLIESNQNPGKKVIFIDELPWLDTPRSVFLPILEHFWNGWASSRKDIVMVVCGSASSWIIKKVLKNHGGLYNRVTERILLKPFTLHECELYAQQTGLVMTRREICSYYMVFGGVPFYWSLLKKGLGVPQNIDHLFFQENGKLKYEYDELFSSLFADADGYRQIISTLATLNRGMSRKEIIQKTALDDGGKLNTRLETLEQCGFIRKYQTFGKRSKDAVYQLMDNLTLFHNRFLSEKKSYDENFWTANLLSPKHNTWEGLAFERICLQHIPQIKHTLQIGGVLTNTYAWSHKPDDITPDGAQIDLLIDRADNIINLCEIKYTRGRFTPDKKLLEELYRKMEVFRAATHTRKAIHLTLITPEGTVDNSYSHAFQSQITLNDLFCIP